MKTGIQMIRDGYAIVNVPAVKNIISGAVYLGERPQNSVKQDVVFNTLALTNEQLQQGVFNVNIHCPNKANVVIDGETDNTQPDIEAFTEITLVVANILNDYVGFDFKLYAQNTGLLLRDTDGTWYVNIRVNYNSFQNHYSNI